MTPAEAQILLSMAAAFDNRKPDPDAAKGWAAALDGLPFDACRLVVIEHYKTSTDWLMPGKVRKDVERLRQKRIAEHPPLTPPAHLADNPRAQIAWIREAKQRIGDGETINPDSYGELKPRRLSDLRQLMPAPDTD